MKRPHILTAAGVGVICAFAGAGDGIAESSAATHHHTATTKVTTGWGGPWGPYGFGGFGAIRSDSILPNGQGGFKSVTVDAGTITSVGANSLTLKEGTTNATYATPTITPSGSVTYTLDGKSAQFSALTAGDRAVIVQSSTGTSSVTAIDSSATASGYRPGRWGPGDSTPNGYGPGNGWGGPGWSGSGTTGW
jgi:VCBS repeat-containing protein